MKQFSFLKLSVIAPILILVIFMIGFQEIISPPGFCELNKKSYSDEFFIKAALVNIKFNSLSSRYQSQEFIDMKNSIVVDKILTDYISRNPDCCKVYRHWGINVLKINPLLWHHSVLVEIRDEKSLSLMRAGGNNRPVNNGRYFVLVDDCLYGSELLVQYLSRG